MILNCCTIVRSLIFFNSSLSPICLSLVSYPKAWLKWVEDSFIFQMIRVVSIVRSSSDSPSSYESSFLLIFFNELIEGFGYFCEACEKSTLSSASSLSSSTFKFSSYASLFTLILLISFTTSVGPLHFFPP